MQTQTEVVPGAAHPRTPVGPAIKLFPEKKVREDGVCARSGCRNPIKQVKNRKWCDSCKKEIRKAQLAENNKVWRSRVKAGVAGHHVAYTFHGQKRPTVWALNQRRAALRLARKGKSVYDADELRVLIERARAKADAKRNSGTNS